MRTGMVDLDISLPQDGIPIERELRHEVPGVWDDGHNGAEFVVGHRQARYPG